MNKLKLSLTNFQSISNGELEFETGLNFIIGQSNSGKSATFRALKACLSNPSGSQRFIKKDSNIAEVTLEYNGNIITWKRTKSESSYIINGESYVKTGKSDAFKIVEDTGFSRDHNDVIMNIEEELQLPFPYGVSKTDLFKLFENIFCVSDSAVILKSAKDHENEVKNDISLLENEATKVGKKLEELKKFKEELNLSQLKELRSELKDKQERLNKLTSGIEVIKVAQKVDEISIPKTCKFNNKLIAYNELANNQKLMKQLSGFHRVSQEIKTMEKPTPKDLRVYKENITLQKEIETLKALADLNTNIEVPLQSVNIEAYLSLCKLSKELKKVVELSKIKLVPVDFSSKIEKYNDLINYKTELDKIKMAGKSANNRKKELSDKLDKIQSKLKKFKVCPLCHRPLEEKENDNAK